MDDKNNDRDKLKGVGSYYYYYYPLDPKLTQQPNSQESPIVKSEEDVEDANNIRVQEFKAKLNPDIFRSRLAVALKYSGKTREEIREKTEITTSMLSNYLYNKKIVPSYRTMSKLAMTLGVNFDWLIGVEEADIEGFKKAGFIRASRGANRRAEDLAKLVAVHMHQDKSALPILSNLLKELLYLNKQQLNQLWIFAQGLNTSTFLDNEVVSTRTIFNAFSLDEKPVDEKYSDLIDLGKFAREYSPKIIEEDYKNTLNDEDPLSIINEGYKILQKDPATFKYSIQEFELFADLIKNRVLSNQFQEQRWLENKKQLQENKNKMIIEK